MTATFSQTWFVVASKSTDANAGRPTHNARSPKRGVGLATGIERAARSLGAPSAAGRKRDQVPAASKTAYTTNDHDQSRDWVWIVNAGSNTNG
jgi:hypothetical protein